MKRPMRLTEMLSAALLCVLAAGCGQTEQAASGTAPLSSGPTSDEAEPVEPPSEPGPTTTRPPKSARQEDCESVDEVDEAGEDQVLVFFACSAGNTVSDFHSFARPVASTASLNTRLNKAVAAYFDGPTRREGSDYFTFYSGFEGPTALNSTEVVGTRAVIDVDFSNRGHSTSSETAHIWNALRLLAFQFPSITEMEPRLNGSCEAFGGVVEAGECLVALRDGDSIPGP